MASSEMQLVCKIIQTGELKRVIEWGIQEDDFQIHECKGIYKQLLAVYQNPETYGSVLGPRLASERFSQLNLNDVDQHVTIEHLCQEVRRRRASMILKNAAEKATELADISPEAALTELQLATANIMRLDAGRTTDVGFDTGLSETYEDYKKAKAGETTGKFMWPWAPLQNETKGGQDDDYIVFYGRPKSMKSWVLCAMIAYMVNCDLRVLVYTKEMTSRNIYKRIAACLAEIPYADVRHGTLTDEQESRLLFWVEEAKKLAGQNKLIVLSAKDAHGRDTVSWLRSKLDKYAPDVVAIDGLYLMAPDNPKIVRDNDRVMNISRGIRSMILETKTPVIATMQANRKAAGHGEANLDEIAFSDAVSQDATMLIRVINDTDGPTISLVFGGAREIEFAGMRIFGIPGTNFTFHSMLTAKEAEKAKMADDPEDLVKDKRQPRTAPQQKQQQQQKSAASRAFDKRLDRMMTGA